MSDTLQEQTTPRRTGWAIVELTPAAWVDGPADDIRIKHLFDRKEDAEKVLAVLESVNIDFTLYQLKEFYTD